MAIAGRVAIVPKGEWSQSVTYDKLDLVTYNGNTFIAYKSSVGVTPVDGDTWMLVMQGIDPQDIENIINGTTPVGDSNKLGGKGASEYALLADLLKHNVTKYRGETKDEISALYASFHTNAKDNDYYKAIISHNVSYDVLGGGTWYLDGVRVTSTYGFQRVTSYGVGTAVAYKRTMYNGVWKSWEKDAITADLANYLPIDGSKSMTGNFTVKKASGACNANVGNDKADIQLRVNSDGSRGLYDAARGKWLIAVKTDETIDGEYLPKTGGTIANVSESPLRINNTRTGSILNAIDFLAEGVRLGCLGFNGVDNPIFYATNYKSYPLLHTGNKPTGTYTGNGSNRTIDIGGIGNGVIVYGSNQTMAIVCNGAICRNGTTLSALTTENVVISNLTTSVKMALNTDNAALNANGVTYYYHLF